MFCLLLVISLLASSLMIYANAHEFSPKRYWNDIYYHSGMNKRIVRIRVDINLVTNTNYKNRLLDAIYLWEWEDNGYCDIAAVYSPAKVTASSAYPSTVNPLYYAITYSYIENATMRYYNGNVINWNLFPFSCSKITRADIFVNMAKQSTDNFNNNDIIKTWVHEIGHVIGLNETNDGTRSVMKQGKGSTFGWSNYWKPQTHDKTDLGRYHSVGWQ